MNILGPILPGLPFGIIQIESEKAAESCCGLWSFSTDLHSINLPESAFPTITSFYLNSTVVGIQFSEPWHNAKGKHYIPVFMYLKLFNHYNSWEMFQ